MRVREVSKYTFGTYRHFNSFDDLSIYKEAIDLCLNFGVNSFDTARAYGNGQSEKLLGVCLSSYPRDSYKISTKVFESAEPGCKPGLNSLNIRVSLSKSLEALRTNYIDTFFMHRFDDLVVMDCLCETLLFLLEKKLIRNIGVSMWPIEKIGQLSSCLSSLGYPNPIYIQDMANAITPLSREKAKFILKKQRYIVYSYSPFARGLLRGKFSDFEMKLASGGWVESGLEQFAENNIAKIKDFYVQNSSNVDYAAVNWCFSSGFDGIIFGYSPRKSLVNTLELFRSYDEKINSNNC